MKINRKILWFGLILFTGSIPGLAGEKEETMEKTNVYRGIPYRDEGMGRRKLVEEDYLLVMQAALKPGQAVPVHKADSNVHILVVEGELSIGLDGVEVKAEKGDIVPSSPGTEMEIVNRSEANASFLIIKTPHPRKMKTE
ncbi:MAG: cupin domain-containing protein [Candidatus Erginobacter occultus]|nr:cupin domain-containing protein [Candidatus Erginobacter occultus]